MFFVNIIYKRKKFFSEHLFTVTLYTIIVTKKLCLINILNILFLSFAKFSAWYSYKTTKRVMLANFGDFLPMNVYTVGKNLLAKLITLSNDSRNNLKR